jgi:hypothetical protein
MLLRRDALLAAALAPHPHAAQLPVADRVRRKQRGVLLRGQHDVPYPAADRRLRDAELTGDRPERHAVLAPEPSGLCSLIRLHEHMFA